MKIAIGAFILATSALAGSAMATDYLPGSATVTGSSAYSGLGGLDLANASSNLLAGTHLQTLSNGETRYIFADGSSADQTLIVDLHHDESVNYFEYGYNGQDRIPTSFGILTSLDGVNFTQVAGPSPVTDYGVAGTYTSAYTLGSVVSARYIEYDFGPNSIGDCVGCGGGVGEGAGIVFLDIQQVPVPEPAVWALMLVGFAGLGAALRRHRQTLASAI